MAYRRLFIWVEGSDDERFFNQIVKPLFEETYDWVEVRSYAGKTSEYIIKFIKSITAMQADYIFTTDLDLAPCITHRKQRLEKTYKNLGNDKIIVAVQEIEGWYLAGLNAQSSQLLGLPIFKDTNGLKKEKFDQLVPKRFDSRIDFMLEILKRFSIDIAKQKNDSFKYFIEKYQ